MTSIFKRGEIAYHPILGQRVMITTVDYPWVSYHYWRIGAQGEKKLLQAEEKIEDTRLQHLNGVDYMLELV